MKTFIFFRLSILLGFLGCAVILASCAAMTQRENHLENSTITEEDGEIVFRKEGAKKEEPANTE